MGSDNSHRERFEYRRKKFEGELSEFSSFLEEVYGDELEHVEGDLTEALKTKHDIDITYELEDAQIKLTSDGSKRDDWVNFAVVSQDPDYARRIKNRIMNKAEGEFDRVVEGNITYEGKVSVEPEKENYDSVEPFIDIMDVLCDWYSSDEGYELTVRPLDDEIDTSAVKRKEGRYHGKKYPSEVSVDIENDEKEKTLHITTQKSDGDAAIQCRFDAEEDDWMHELRRVVHGHYLASTGFEPETVQSQWDEFIVESPDVSMDEVGGLDNVKQRITEDIIHPLKYPEESRRMGVAPTTGALFYGPPGTGKTLMAHAIAAEADADLYEIDMSEIVSKYVGETEKHINALFDHVEENGPAIVFFDEADTAIPDREQSDKDYNRRQTNEILRRLQSDDVITIAATNQKGHIDDAGKRSGRIDDSYTFAPPDQEGREDILKIHVEKNARTATKDDLFADIDYTELAAEAEGATGADIETWVKKAVRNAAYGEGADLDTPPEVTKVTEDDFYEALELMEFSTDTGDDPMIH